MGVGARGADNMVVAVVAGRVDGGPLPAGKVAGFGGGWRASTAGQGQVGMGMGDVVG